MSRYTHQFSINDLEWHSSKLIFCTCYSEGAKTKTNCIPTNQLLSQQVLHISQVDLEVKSAAQLTLKVLVTTIGALGHFKYDNYSTVGGDGGCRVGKV